MTNERTRAVANLLRTAFPDPDVRITDEAVTASLSALSLEASKRPEMFGGHGVDLLPLEEGFPVSKSPSGKEDPRLVGYWLARGTHHRTSPIESKFPVQLGFVEVSVCDGWEGNPIETEIGTMYAGDHKLYSLQVAKDYLKDVSAALQIKVPPLDRVHVISLARSGGARFGAIGVYLFYAEGEKKPFSYVLEAGMATGESRVLYFGPDFHLPILRRSFYKPTPFSDPSYKYRGLVTLSELGEIEKLLVEAQKTDKDPAHIRIEIDYTPVPAKDAPNVFPAMLTIQAACRVAAIAEASGVPFPDLGPLTPLFAHLGRELYPWIVKPGAKS